MESLKDFEKRSEKLTEDQMISVKGGALKETKTTWHSPSNGNSGCDSKLGGTLVVGEDWNYAECGFTVPGGFDA